MDATHYRLQSQINNLQETVEQQQIQINILMIVARSVLNAQPAFVHADAVKALDEYDNAGHQPS